MDNLNELVRPRQFHKFSFLSFLSLNNPNFSLVTMLSLVTILVSAFLTVLLGISTKEIGWQEFQKDITKPSLSATMQFFKSVTDSSTLDIRIWYSSPALMAMLAITNQVGANTMIGQWVSSPSTTFFKIPNFPI